VVEEFTQMEITVVLVGRPGVALGDDGHQSHERVCRSGGGCHRED
jgi:hypothetical protein